MFISTKRPNFDIFTTFSETTSCVVARLGRDQVDQHHQNVILLLQVLRPFMLRRTKREVEKELPSKTEHVVKCAMSAWQKILYQQITDKVTNLCTLTR